MSKEFEINLLQSIALLCKLQVRESGADRYIVSDINSGFEFCSDFDGAKAFLLGVRFGQRD